MWPSAGSARAGPRRIDTLSTLARTRSSRQEASADRAPMAPRRALCRDWRPLCWRCPRARPRRCRGSRTARCTPRRARAERRRTGRSMVVAWLPLRESLATTVRSARSAAGDEGLAHEEVFEGLAAGRDGAYAGAAVEGHAHHLRGRCPRPSRSPGGAARRGAATVPASRRGPYEGPRRPPRALPPRPEPPAEATPTARRRRHFAAVDDGHAVAEHLHVAQDVRAEHHRAARARAPRG
jgi:hypothetical protein